jgi:hypothetical protein
MNQLRVAAIALVIAATLASTPQQAESQLDTHHDFLTAAYRDLLGREPDPGGYEYWLGLLNEGVPASAVAQAIGDADEQRRLVVTQAYDRVLHRDPDGEGLAFWAADMIDRSAEIELYSLFFASPEYFIGSGETNAGYVTALYQDILSRTPDDEGLTFWTGLIDSGIDRATIAREFIRSTEAILQPNLSITSSNPVAGSLTNDLSRISIDFDAEIDAESSAVIVSAGGIRIVGVTSSGETNNQLTFRPTSIPQTLRNGAAMKVVVTVFAYTGSEFGRTDYTFTLGPTVAAAPAELIVAFYGHAKTDVLGVLGEGTPQQALVRLDQQAEPYRQSSERDDARPVVPAFELIATLVTAAPGADGLYRSRTAHDLIQPYLETIRAANGYLILDLQPGRADLEDEARFYEPLLLNPEVGLALDPEWKVGPDETPQGRVGALEASEINRVTAYVSDLVIANDLPSKIVIVHLFEASMVRNPELIVNRPGVRIIFQADGEGGPAAKAADYNTLIPDRFGQGFKVFYDEDSPTLNPDEVLALLDPDPAYISYQ